MVVAGRRTLSEPAERTGAHGYAGKRVRDDVGDGIALLVFSLATSVASVAVVALVTSLAGRP